MEVIDMDKESIKLLFEQREKLEIMVDLYSEKLNELSTHSNGLLTEEIRTSDF